MALFSSGGSGDGLVNTLASSQADTGVTICCWLRDDGGASTYAAGWSLDNSASPTSDYLFVETDFSHSNWQLWSSASFFANSTNITTVSANTWIFIAVVRNATDDTDIYYRAEGDASLTSMNWATDTGGFTADQLQVATNGYGEHFSGDVIGLKAYDAILTEAEILAESYRTQPFRTTDLVACHPLNIAASSYALDYSPADNTVAAAPSAGAPSEGGMPAILAGPQSQPLVFADLTIDVEDQRVVQGRSFRYRPRVNGGTGSYSLSVVSGSLPSGLTASGEVVSGTTSAGEADYTVTLRATSGSETADVSFTVKVLAEPTFTTEKEVPVFVILGDRDVLGNLGSNWLGFREYDNFQFGVYTWNDNSLIAADPGFTPTGFQAYLPAVNSNTGEFGGVFGPDVGLLEIVRRDPELSGRDIYFVKTPKPGTLYDDGGNWSWTHDAGYHYSLAKFVQMAQILKAIGLRPDVRGIFWIGGRMDGGNQTMADAMPANLRTLVDDILSDYAPYALSDGTPRVFIGTPPPSDSPPPVIDDVREAVCEIEQTDPRVRTVHYDQCHFNGLAADPDNLTATGMIHLGWRMAWAWRVPLEDMLFLACMSSEVLREYWWTLRGQGPAEKSVLTRLLPQRLRGDHLHRQSLEVLLTRCREGLEADQWTQGGLEPSWPIVDAGGVPSASAFETDHSIGGAGAGIYPTSVPSTSAFETDHIVGFLILDAGGIPSGSYVSGAADGLRIETSGAIIGAGGVSSTSFVPTDHSVSTEAPDFGETT